MIRDFLYPVVAVLTVGCATAKVAPPATATAPNTSAQSGANAARPLSLLAIPDGLPIICREPPADPAHPMPGAVVREFRFGSPPISFESWPREITVAFDSAGNAIILSDELNQLPKSNESA
jgi:hypothetical protein